ncbi:PREDICTED: uncharacterized protein LOC104805648 [Tarenaya hassleriana]|uniref:uncharacterized protein LOC104805648 n=1 Tax=Tarenaya hassleriana TaxID=28532 RepID=UPI00053C5510|nr:PREDICTED: uncharacterized protein LOC104805648 [Tarenaya hassleriana]
MEPRLLDDGDFWLPPEFLTDEDFLMDEENKVFKGIDTFDGSGFGKYGGSKFFFPNESRSVFGSLAVNSGLSSPVESLVGSTETESDEENFISGLARQMAHSTLEEDFAGEFGGNHNFPAGNKIKGWSQSGSPESTLCAAGISCYCRRRVPSPAAVDLYFATAEEMDEPYGINHGGRGLLGPPVKPSPVPVPTKNPNIGSGYYHHPPLHYQKLQAILFQQLKQQQMMKHRQVMRNMGRRSGGNDTGRAVGLSPCAWPNLQHAQPTGKRVSAGTGVFLPRRVPATETQKKQTLSTMVVPARVAEALNLKLDDSAAQRIVRPRFESPADLNDTSLRFRSSNNGGFSGQNRGGIRAEQTAASNELRLPSDWSY